MKIGTRKMIDFSFEKWQIKAPTSTQKLRTCTRYEHEEEESINGHSFTLSNYIPIHTRTFHCRVDCDCENCLCGVAVVQDFFQKLVRSRRVMVENSLDGETTFFSCAHQGRFSLEGRFKKWLRVYDVIYWSTELKRIRARVWKKLLAYSYERSIFRVF